MTKRRDELLSSFQNTDSNQIAIAIRTLAAHGVFEFLRIAAKRPAHQLNSEMTTFADVHAFNSAFTQGAEDILDQLQDFSTLYCDKAKPRKKIVARFATPHSVERQQTEEENQDE